MEEKIAKAARAFGAFKGPIFNNSNLSYKTKRMVYKAVVLGVLLYGSETWTTKRDATKKMEAFHNRCLRQIVGITSAQQRTELISSVQVACQFGMEESLEDIVIARRLEMAGPPGKNGGPQTSQEDTVWLAASAPPRTWDQNEMVRSCQKRFEKV